MVTAHEDRGYLRWLSWTIVYHQRYVDRHATRRREEELVRMPDAQKVAHQLQSVERTASIGHLAWQAERLRMGR